MASAEAQPADPPRPGPPRWVVLLSAIGLVLLAGVAVWTLLQALRESAEIDALRVSELGRAAENLATWPDTASEIGRTNLFPTGASGARRQVWFYHPDLGEFSVRYAAANKTCGRAVTVVGENKLVVSGQALPKAGAAPADDGGEPDYAGRARRASLFRGDPRPICFKVGPLGLGQIVTDLGGFDQLLLVRYDAAKDGKSPEGRVVAQIGPSPLPIQRLADLPRLRSGLEDLVVTTARSTLAASGAKLGEAREGPSDALEPINSRVAGKSYRFYLQPIALNIIERSRADPPLAGVRYYLVGAAPADGVGPGLKNAQVKLLAFALAVALLIALVPVIKLATLGPVDALKPIDVALVGVGLLVACAVATTALAVAYDVFAARAVVATRLGEAVETLRRGMTANIRTVVADPAFRTLSAGLRFEREPPSFVVRAAGIAGPFIGRTEAFLPDSAILLDANGRQPLNTVVRTTRPRSGANFTVPDRDYFRRALDGDPAPGTARLRERFADDWPRSEWARTTGGLVFDQIRSRQDGVPKTAIAAALGCGGRGEPACADRTRPAVLRVTFVMAAMLALALPDGIRYAVVDGRSPGLPVLFHSDRGRAKIERLADGLSEAARAGIAAAAAEEAPCPLTGPRRPQPPPLGFTGNYEGDRTIFAAARLGCTDWIIVAMKSRAAADRRAAFGPLNALMIWTGLIGMLLVPWAVAAMLLGDRAWCWLWPTSSPRLQPVYRGLVAGLAAVLAVGFALLLPWPAALLPLMGMAAAAGAVLLLLRRAGSPASLPRPTAAFLATAAPALVIVLLAGIVWGAGGAAMMLGLIAVPVAGVALFRATQADRGEETPPLGAATQRWFTAAGVLVLFTVAVLPIAALSRDAGGYFGAMSAGDDTRAACGADVLGAQRRAAIARAFEPGRRWPVAQPGPCATDGAPASLTGAVRSAVAYDRYAAFGPPLQRSVSLDLTRWVLLAGLAGLFALILLLAVWSALRGLFGFGVAIEAIAFPAVPQADLRRLPARSMVIAPTDQVRRALIASVTQHGRIIDLFEATAPDAPEPDPQAGAGYLLTDLEMLFRDPERRLSALRLFERLVARQEAMEARGQVPFRLCLIAELSPLDRLLQSYEREAEELDEIDAAERQKLRTARGRHREDVRWSRVFEGFAAFIYAAAPRPVPAEVATPAARTLWQELSRLPDHALAPIVSETGDQPVGPARLVAWVNQPRFAQASDRALVDYLASMLIEHYHFAWSVSSRAERLLLHRFAYGHIPNMARAYALRALVRRGLVVLDPYPRIMNRSFAQFVRHAEKPTTLKRWRQHAEGGGWRTYRLPLAAGLLVAVGVIVLTGLRNGDSATSLLPLIAAAGPVLINALGSARRSAAA